MEFAVLFWLTLTKTHSVLPHSFWLTKVEMLEQHHTKTRTGTKVESRSYRELELYSQEHDLLSSIHVE